ARVAAWISLSRMKREYRICWSPKLDPADLVRLYQNDAARTLDEELLDHVGWTIYSRLRDVMLVSQSRVECPRCSTEFEVRWRGVPPETLSTCPNCGWHTTAEYYTAPGSIKTSTAVAQSSQSTSGATHRYEARADGCS